MPFADSFFDIIRKRPDTWIDTVMSSGAVSGKLYFGTLDNVLANIDRISGAKRQENLRAAGPIVALTQLLYLSGHCCARRRPTAGAAGRRRSSLSDQSWSRPVDVQVRNCYSNLLAFPLPHHGSQGFDGFQYGQGSWSR